MSLATWDRKETRLFVVLAANMVTTAVVAEVISVKLFQVPFYAWLGWDYLFTLTCGSLLWPVVFLTTDTINEFYGARAVRFISWLTIAMIGLTFLALYASISVTGAAFSPVDDATFAKVFGQGGWIIVGSMMAFFLAQLVDVTVFQAIRKALQGRHIWARATGSTIVSQLIDSFVVIYIAFWLPGMFGQKALTAGEALNTSLSSFAYKVGMAVALTPVIYFVHWAVHRWLGDEVAHEMAETAAQGG